MKIKLEKWLKEFEEDCGPSSTRIAKKLATDPYETFEIVKSNECGSELSFAIVPLSNTGFWMDAFRTRKEAVALCKKLGFRLAK